MANFFTNNRGMSDLVSIVLLILISITLVSIVFVYIVDYSKKPIQLSPHSCIEFQANPSIKIERACFNSLTGDVEALISRQVSNFEIYSLKTGISLNGNSKSWQCGKCGSCSIVDEGESKLYYFGPVAGKPESLVLTVNDCAEINFKKIDEC